VEANAESLQKRYRSMETDALIKLHRSGDLTESALLILDEVLKSRGITDAMRAKRLDRFELGMPQSTEKTEGRVTGGWFSQKLLFGMSLRGWLSIFMVIIVGHTINSYFRPVKTNRSYLKELIASGYLEKAAVAFVDAAKTAEMRDDISYEEWEKIKKGLSECMIREANSYLVSGDSYLNARANKETPHILAERFLNACGALE